ncbi:MAG: galactokinase [Micrococcales bacterium]|nr:galactokinase [Micrococcales bacterium]
MLGVMANFIAPWTSQEGTDRARAQFVAEFGRPPEVVCSAPGRVNLIGEHTDIFGGLCLPIALPHRTFVALSSSMSDAVQLASSAASPWQAGLAEVAPGRLSGWGAYPAGVAWALARRGLLVDGFLGFVDSCVPLGAGLSSSAALECAFALGLNRLSTEPWAESRANRLTMAAAAIDAENLIVGAATGSMDQTISLLATLGQALLLDFTSGQHTAVPFDLTSYDLSLLVIDTRTKHDLADGQYAARRAQGDLAAQSLDLASLSELGPDQLAGALDSLDDCLLRRRVRHVVSENQRVRETVAALELGDFGQVGRLFSASHVSLRDDYQVSSAELDLAVDSAMVAGAMGARMTGGGFGGSAIALVSTSRIDAVAEAVTSAFADQGWAEPAFLLATAGGPAQSET